MSQEGTALLHPISLHIRNSRRKLKPLRVIEFLSIGSIVLVLFSCLNLCSSAQNKGPYNKKTLIDALTAREKNLSIEDFVRLIRERGVDFEMTAKDEVAFTKAGAAPEIISAIRDNYRPTNSARTLTISSTPGECQVFVDGQPRGTTNAGGVLVLRGIRTGSYRVTVRKQNYRDEERRVLVLPSGTLERFFLSPLPGRLNVTVNTGGAHIRIQNKGEYEDKVTDLELSPDAYEIEISKSGYRTVTQTVRIAAGAPFYLPVTLEKLSIDEMVAQAKDNYDRHNCSAAVSLARVILTTQPEHAKANDLMGECLYFEGRYDDAIPYFMKAIVSGEPTVIPVLHKHGGSWSGKTLSPGRLIFYRETFEFNSTDYPDQSFRIPYSNVTEMSVKDQNAHLNLKVRVKLPKNRKETQEEYNLYSTDAVATGVIITCSQCSSIMRFTLQLLRRFR